jgi:broad specificity phosphatase PhoE
VDAIAMDATRLLLVRHGEARAASDGIIAGPTGCTGLSADGRRQADRLAARLDSERAGVDVLLASPLRRAMETAGPLGERLGLQVRVEPDLEELRPGAADGLTWAEFEARHGRFDMVAEPARPFAPGGESWFRFRERVDSTLGRLLDEFHGQTVVAVCHGGFIVMSMLVLLDIPRPGNPTHLAPTLTSLTEWSHDDRRWTLERYNDHAHLARLDVSKA